MLAGYAVTAGHYSFSSQLHYAAGAPRSNHLQGEVVIFQFPTQRDHPIEEKFVLKQRPDDQQTGSYFGSVLLTAKFSGQTYDDLLVAAPQYSNSYSRNSRSSLAENLADEKSYKIGDEGCVFLYSSETDFVSKLILVS